MDKSVDKGLVKVVLNGVQINSETSSPIYISEAKEVMLVLADASENSITQGSRVKINEDEEPTAAIFSKADLTIGGGGSLMVKTSYNDGITSRDDLMITGGNITIDAASDAIVGKDKVEIMDGTLTITAGKDGIRATNDTEEGKGNVTIHNGAFTIKAANDGIQAYNVLSIEDGKFDIATGGGYPGRSISSGNEGFGRVAGQAFGTAQSNAQAVEESKKGIKSTGKVIIAGGVFKLSSYDDAIHSNDEIIINGGDLSIQSGDDAMHADNSITINAGQIDIENSYEGLEAAHININGGEVSIVSSDDGINVNQNSGLLAISKGSVSIVADGDGLDSNGNIEMTGGVVYVDGPTANMNGSVDYNGKFMISGGILIASGSSGMAQAPSSGSTQPSILMYYGTSQSAGTTLYLKDSTGKQIASFTPSKSYSSVVISTKDLAIGSSYTLYAGSNKIVDVSIAGMVSAISETGVISQGRPGRKSRRRPVPSSWRWHSQASEKLKQRIDS